MHGFYNHSLYFPCCILHPRGYCSTANLYFFMPPPFSLGPPTPSLSGNQEFVLGNYESVSVLSFCLFILFFIFHISEVIWYLFLSELILLITIPSRFFQIIRFHFLQPSNIPFLCVPPLLYPTVY